MNVAVEVLRVSLDDEDVARFWSKVDIRTPDQCWPWKAQSKTQSGYGSFKVNGRFISAHRIAFAITRLMTPARLFVLHRCDNPPCCNPLHLLIGTAKDNTRDATLKGRMKFKPCDSSHFNIGKWHVEHMPFRGESHPAAKLTEEKVYQIKTALSSGEKGVDIAKRFGCSTYTVSNIKLGKQWSHVCLK